MTNSPYQPLFDKLDATIAALEEPTTNVDTVVDDATDLLKRLGIVAASLLNGSVAAFAHLILEAEPTEQTPISGDEAASESGQTTEGSVDPVTETESDGDEEGPE